eukprot:TRINITY_DN56978_c0_g1_i1.p1 TRINITY_DN56978_c0_g1~~TRINITY_DN56978_c0_g1_i1.p1  ORF type:complete len:315 (+),score=17.54 TRINITY_DN56978_c0_g1_i1:14-958(+)
MARNRTKYMLVRTYLRICRIRRYLAIATTELPAEDAQISLALLCLLSARASSLIRSAFPQPYRRPPTRGFERIAMVHGGYNRMFDALRFHSSDVCTLAQILLPPVLYLPHRQMRIHAVDALATTLFRLSSPNSLAHVEAATGYPDWLSSTIIRTTVQYIAHHWNHVLSSPPWLNAGRVEAYRHAIRRHCIVGWIDGTRRPIPRPTCNQRSYYNGWLHNHNILFIAIAFPDGTMMLRGPVAGRWNDLTVMRSEGVLQFLDDVLPVGTVVDGDSIFPINHHILSRRALELTGGDPGTFCTWRVRVCMDRSCHPGGA